MRNLLDKRGRSDGLCVDAWTCGGFRFKYAGESKYGGSHLKKKLNELFAELEQV